MDDGFHSAAPMIVRLAGLPAEVMEPFASQACLEEAQSLFELIDELASARAQMVERLYEKINGAPAEVRRVLLAAKRDCFNGRSIAARGRDGDWSVVEGAAPVLASRLCELEDDLELRQVKFEETYRQELYRQRRHLASLIDEGNLKRGVALGSPVTFRNLSRLAKPPEAYKRKERRLEQTQLRYVSRAALKLSPFSTLTRVGLGLVSRESPGRSPHLETGELEQRQLRWIDHDILNKYWALLLLFPQFRSRLRVALNPTLEKIGPTRYRLLQPFHWRLNLEAEEFRHFEDALISVKLGGPLIETLRQELTSSRRLDELVERVCGDLQGEPATVKKVIDKLLEMGFLEFVFPWATNDSDPERQLLAVLEDLSEEEPFGRLHQLFGRLVDLRDASSSSRSLPGVVQEIDRLRRRGFKVLTDALGLPEAGEVNRGRQFHEDVFLLSRARDDLQAIARVDRQAAERALASIRPLVLYSDLNYTHYELLHSLGALAARQWPGQQEIGFIDLFQAAQALWKDYTKASTAAVREWQEELWNPFALEAIVELQALRDTVHKGMTAAMRQEGEDFVIDLERAQRAVAQIPEHYTPPFGACLFMQPADPDSEEWVVNRMLDGTGRFATRFIPVMADGMRRRYTEHMRRCGAVALGPDAEMVELLSARCNHLNVHPIQTRRVLEMPGERSELPPDRRLGLQDLRVRLDRRLPYLTDRSGQHVVPIFLGCAGLVGMPTLVKFVSQFGLAEFRLMHPPRPPRSRDGTKFHGRLRIGNLIVRRKLWELSPVEIFGAHAEKSDAELFLAANRWRLAQGIPRRAFISEKLDVEFSVWNVYKPQYIDFSSPSFLPILRSCLGTSEATIKLEEMLPNPEAFPAGDDGQRWAFEVQLEDIALNDVASASPG